MMLGTLKQTIKYTLFTYHIHTGNIIINIEIYIYIVPMLHFFSLVDLKTYHLKATVKCKNGHKGVCQNTFPWLVYLFQL